uniref:Uncharacterized protein n=1 Tax=Arundo donax TaxID=35708 RepID=A0A0A9CRB0_ARUDO
MRCMITAQNVTSDLPLLVV